MAFIDDIPHYKELEDDEYYFHSVALIADTVIFQILIYFGNALAAIIYKYRKAIHKYIKTPSLFNTAGSIVCTSIERHMIPNGENIFDWLRRRP